MATAVVPQADVRIAVNRTPVIRRDIAFDWLCAGDAHSITRAQWPLTRPIFTKAQVAAELKIDGRTWEQSYERFPKNGAGSWTCFSMLAAVVLAVELGADSIDLFGADFAGTQDADGVTHPDYDRSPRIWRSQRELLSQLSRFIKPRVVRRLRCPVYVSAFTTEYADEAAQLKASADRFSIKTDVKAMASAGSWVKNCGLKAHVISGVIQQAKTPIVWLDADARVAQYPALFDNLHERADFAAHWLRDELLSGTLFFNDTAPARKLVDEWTKACAASPGEWDQKVLQRILTTGLRIERLPAEYCWIEGGRRPDISEQCYGRREPVIVQTQASRRLR